MAKQPRRQHGSNLQHVISRGVADDFLVPTPEFCRLFWHALGGFTQEYGVELFEMCLMGTHYHLLLRGDKDAVAAALHRAHHRLAMARNRCDSRKGAVFGRRYKVIGIEDESHLKTVIRYIPLNPVAAQLCSDPARWDWSTHTILAGRGEAPSWFDRDRALRTLGFADCVAYERFVIAATPLELPPMTRGELTRHRVGQLAIHGMGVEQIATALDLTADYVAKVLRASTLRGVAS